jgi:uncharacterized protein (DUF1697 family)
MGPRRAERTRATETHVALLRGINVGGRNRIPMVRLVDIFESAGYTRVRTYIQSGNVVFDAPSGAILQIPTHVSALIKQQLALDVPTVARTASEFEQIVMANPFLSAHNPDLSALHVGFLANRPSAGQVAAIDVHRSPPDECVSCDRELYLRCPNGLARTKFTSAYLDRTLGTTTTIRNWRTTLAVLDLVRA